MFKHVCLIAFLIGMDLLSKTLTWSTLVPGLTVETSVPFVNFLQVKNFGVGFGLAQGYVPVIIVLNFILLALITYHWFKVEESFKSPYSFLLAGGIANLYDRLVFGYVRDFILLSYGAYAFPVFNFADCYLTLGVVLACLDFPVKYLK